MDDTDCGSFLLLIFAVLGGAFLSTSVCEKQYLGNPINIHLIMNRPDQAYQVISQEEIDGDQYATVRTSNNRLLFIKSAEKLPTPEFSVVTFNGEKKILLSQNGKLEITTEISVPTIKPAEATTTGTANPVPTPLPAEGE
ncbi:MAG: hypothetical protein WC517_03150 [Patescibacteria group bacterium]